MYSTLRALGSTLAGILLIPCAAYCQTAVPCEGTAEHPVQICFDVPPLTVDHCRKEIGLHFRVGLFPDSHGVLPSYYFTYQITKDGVLDKLENPLDSKFLLTQADPISQIPPLNIPYQGSGNFSVTVSAYAEDRDPVSLPSQDVHLSDSVLVTAIVVGVSSYASSQVPQLMHPDEDAKSFDRFLKAILPANVLSAELLTSDNADPSQKPTVASITDALSSENSAPHSCSNEDWFIFYFSGHGVVGSNEAEVGSNGTVATHYLSTTLLDPAKLDSTAIPIEDILRRIRRLPAGNKLIILDSCFSGSSKSFHPSSTAGVSAKNVPARQKSFKVAYVYNKTVVDPYEFEARNPKTGNGDLLVFKEAPVEEEEDSRRALYLSAALADHVAEEGLEKYSDQHLSFTPSDEETDDQKQLGHGLYTFTLLWNLLTQLPKESILPEILKGQKPAPTAAGQCSIDFSSAHSIGAGDIARLQLASQGTNQPRDFQKPEVAGHTQTELPKLSCGIPTRDSSLTGPK